jgi:acetyltransferase-like isoleucine patch superfamily enzyme
MENIFFDKSNLKYCGRNVIIGKTVRIRKPELVSLDDNTIIDDFTYISGEVNIGKYVHIGPSCSLQASESSTRIYAASSDYLSCSLDFPTIPKEFKYGGVSEEVIFDSFALVGANCVVLPGCLLPIGFATGAQTILTKFISMEAWMYYDFKRDKLFKRKGKEDVLSIAKTLTGIDYTKRV